MSVISPLVEMGVRANGVLIFLKDLFSTPEASPLTNPHACDIGILTITAQVSAEISGGVLSIPISGSFTAYVLHTIKNGDVWRVDCNWSNNGGTLRLTLGNSNTGPGAIGINVNNGHQIEFYESGAAKLRIVATGQAGPKSFYVIRSGDKIFGVIVGGIFGTGTLVWVGETISNNCYINIASNTSVVRTLDNLILENYPAWGSSGVFEAVKQDITTDGQTFAALADGLFRHTIVAQAGVVQSFYFRYLSDDDCLRLDCDQAAGTIKLYSVVGGVATELNAGKTQTWVAGNSYRLSVYAWGTSVQTYVDNTLKHTASDGTLATGLKVSHAGVNLYGYKLPVEIPSGL